ncbi:MAG: bifunctional acetate--CoA ligase family protein/GNAT family N-acetyltransferase [Candidatus Bathyarchaeota archaeon]|nr:bifunctional acetate--CoA ligase family protein/GNAT family N-acetyltransferase [Candidatus Bathyarchaeota archaeon]
MGIENLSHIFNPKRVAVIGASERAESFGARILRNLASASDVEVYPVNPFRRKVQGIPAYPIISRVPAEIDLAVVATPAHTVPQIVEECGKAHVKGIIITSAGFQEDGSNSQLLERQILEHKKTYGMRILGTSSFGVIRPSINLYATFGKQAALPGKIAFISQSAALCALALDWAAEAQVGLSAVVSTGSMVDVDLGDLIDYFGMDPQTRSIVLYIESVKNARKFLSAARGFARTKPIIVLKAGCFQETRLPALCHSGRLSGQDAVHDAAFRRVGIVRVDAVSELFNCAGALTMQPNPAGPNPVIVTNAGGLGIMAADRLIAEGGKLVDLSPQSAEVLAHVLPYYCSVANPLDIFEDASPERFKAALEICLGDSQTSGCIVIFTPQGITEPSALAAVVMELAGKHRKPLLVALTGEENSCREARKLLHSNRVPAFRTPEEAVSTYMYMWRYTQNLELLYQTPKEFSVDLDVPHYLKGILRRAFCEGRAVLTLPESLRFLEAYQIPTVKTVIAKTRQEATTLAGQLGYPVAMKVVSPQLTHKSEIEGVILNVCSPTEVPVFFDELACKVKNCGFTAEFQGVALQPMVRKQGYELLLGSRRDPQFGSIILFGTGGTSTELFKDASVGFPPLNQVLARRLMETTAIYRYASSAKHPLNAGILDEILVKFSQLVSDFPEIDSIDINPVIADESSAVAVDARIVIDASRVMREVAEHHEHLVIAPYPKKYIIQRKLKNGVEVLLRPVKPEDEGRFNELFQSLSPQTVHFRFFQIIQELSHETLTRYCNLDYDREVALVAELQDGGDSKIIGVVRVILESDGETGEFALLVGDKWQRLGLGSKLMDSLIDVAKDLHLKRIFSYVLSNNYKMLQLCNKKEFRVEIVDEETVKASLTLR